ncbi:MAG: ABC transporter substrate-binding protein [Motiliproteus sp.]
MGLLLAPQAQASWEEAGAVVSDATLQMKQLLVDETLRDESEFQRLYVGVDQLLSPVVDFNRISRGVMAKHYRNASDEQRQRFADVFKGTLIKTYSKALTIFQIADFELIPNPSPSRKKGREFVRVDVLGTDGQHYLLDYFMVQGDQGWKLVNVRVDGINLGQVFKRQFAEALETSKGDIDAVIDQWAAMSDPSSQKGS